jgi:hypothetical protein
MVEAILQVRPENRQKVQDIFAMQGNPREAVLLSYIAGILDGEGAIGIKRYRPTGRKRTVCYFAYICCGMIDKQIPLLLQETFGGSCREECVQRQRSIWRWDINGRLRIIAVLEALLPYLRVKREQAETLLHYCYTTDAQRKKNGREFAMVSDEELLRREEAYLELRKLKSAGAPATTKQVGTREGEAIV